MTITFEINGDIPIPQPRSRGIGGEILNSMKSLSISQSFFVPENPQSKTDYGKCAARLSTYIHQLKTRQSLSEANFTTRIIKENGVRGVRVWRVA